jgi:thiol-disulfide isomerase/thioredoxin
MKHTFILAIILSTSSMFAQQTLQISGKIEGLGNESMVLRYRVGNTNHSDTITAQNDVVSFSKKIEFQDPTWAVLTYIGSRQNDLLMTSGGFYLSNGANIVLKGELDDLYHLNAINSWYNDDVRKHRNEMSVDYHNLMVFMRLTQHTKSLPGNLATQINERMIASLIRASEIEKQFAKSDGNSEYAALLFSRTAQESSASEIERVYNNFTPEIQNSIYGKRILEALENVKAEEAKKADILGNNALNFTQKDINGDIVTLEQFKGKYVMMVFWGSWCGPCRASHPKMLREINTHRANNIPLEVMAFAQDRDKTKWVEAIEKDKLENMIHINLFDRHNDENVAAIFNVRAYPTKILVDQNGNVVDIFVGATDAIFDKLNEIFGL